MKKSELIETVQRKHPSLSLKMAEKIVNLIFNEIIESLAAGKRVDFRGFGAFTVRKRASRSGRNPRTGESVTVPAKAVPFFKTSKILKERLNPSSGKKDTKKE